MPSLPGAWTVAAPDEASWVVVGATDIRVAGADPVLTLQEGRVPAASGSDNVVQPLAARLQSDPLPGGTVGLAIAPDVPAQTALAVINTLGHAERTDLALLVRGDDEAMEALPLTVPTVRPGHSLLLGAIDDSDALGDVLGDDQLVGSPDDIFAHVEEVGIASAPPGGDDEASGEDDQAEQPARRAPQPVETVRESSALSLTVTLSARGMLVSGSGGVLAPGCQELRSDRALTIPLHEGEQDTVGLRRCLTQVHGQYPAEDDLLVIPDPDVPFRDVARVIATGRGVPDRPLFPRAMIGGGVR